VNPSMSAALMLAALLLPWLAIGTLRAPRTRAVAFVVAPLPLLMLALGGDTGLTLPRVLLGSGFGVDAVNRPLLLLAGAGWALAGAFVPASVREHAPRFGLFWLLTLAGQALALLATDMAGFYCGYALMTLAACGLVVHDGDAAAWRAGRVYLVLALGGEMLILAGLLMIAAAVGNLRFVDLPATLPGISTSASWLLFAGFAVKLGVVPLHVWLPLAHPVAPVPASAVLSGVLVKAGLLGMLRLLPPGALPDAEALLVLGLVGAGYGALLGLTQSRLKTVLAYSTVSQMGLVLVAFAAVQHAGSGPLALSAVGLLALHHGLNKTALFLAAGHRLRGWLAHLLFLLPALALAGLPLSAGALAKHALKDALHAGELDRWLLALSLGSALTTALLLHAWRLARAQTHGRERVHPAWLAAVLAGIALPWAWAEQAPALAGFWAGLWPILLGIGLYLFGRRLPPSMKPRVAEGDLVRAGEWLAVALRAPVVAALAWWRDLQPRVPDLLPGARRMRALDRALVGLPAVGLAVLVLLLALRGLLAAT